jgi:PAS domain S-box-containing protein
MSDQGTAAGGGFWRGASGEQALDRYQMLVNMVEDGIYQLDADGRFVAVNDTIVELTGYTRDQLLGEHASIVLPEEEVRRIQQEIHRRFDDDERGAEPIELTARTAAGKTIPCELELHLLVEDGSFQGTIGVVRDITDRKQTERQLSRLIDNVPGMVYRCRNERGWPMEFVSDACEELTGYDPAQLVRGDVVWGEDIVVDADREPLWETVQRETDTNQTFSTTYRIETTDGEQRWVRDYGRGIFEDDELVEIEGVISDITERKRAEQRLAEERDMFADGPAVVFRWLPDEEAGWPIEYVSENVKDVLGYTAAELESGSVAYADLLLEEEIDRITRETRETSDPSTERLSHEPYRIKTRDGDVRWVKDITKIIRDDSGEITNYLGYLVDITERKARQRELLKYETIVETIDDGIYVVDEKGRFTMVNDAYTDLTGYSREELLGSKVSLVADDELIERATEVESEMRAGRLESPILEADIVTADGDRVPAEAMFSMLPDDGGERIGVVRDITDRRERERALKQNKEQLETLFETLPVGVVVATADGQIIEANDTAHEIWGSDLFETTSVSEYEQYPVFDPDTKERIAPEEMTLPRVLRGETVTDPDVYEFRPGDGDSRIIEFEGKPIRDDQDQVVRGVVTMRDVTERWQVQRTLEESERRYRTLIEHFPNGAVTLVDKNLEYRTVGGDPLDVANITPQEAEGQPVEAIVPSELADQLVPRYEAALEGEASRFEAEIDGRTYQFRIVPVRDGDGSVFAAIGMSQDITEVVETQRELAESERRYRTLVENFPNGAVGLYDRDLEYTAIGGKLLDVIDLDPEDRVRSSVYDIYPDDLVEEVEPYFHAALEGETNVFEVEFHDRNLYANTLPVRDADDDVYAGMLVVQDVTEQREYEHKLEESNERLEQFAYAASHDLQEPLRMVSSYLQLLKNRYSDELDADGQEFIEFAVDGADRMREMIEGLLQYSRVDTQGDPFHDVALDAVLADVRSDLQVKIEETDTELTAETLPVVYGDGNQLGQLFQNLLDNAMEYSGDDSPQIHVGAERNGDEWLISVSDDGIGIDSENPDRVFEVFESLQGHEEAGTGIGLALVERIVERHGGAIWVDSDPGEGATFSFTLPAVDASERDQN